LIAIPLFSMLIDGIVIIITRDKIIIIDAVKLPDLNIVVSIIYLSFYNLKRLVLFHHLYWELFYIWYHLLRQM
jgi:hypothetical protein